MIRSFNVMAYISDRTAFKNYKEALEDVMQFKTRECAPVYSSFWLMETIKMLKNYYSPNAWKEAMEALEVMNNDSDC